MVKHFPEFENLRPHTKYAGDYWWPLSDPTIRTEILKELIEETKP